MVKKAKRIKKIAKKKKVSSVVDAEIELSRIYNLKGKAQYGKELRTLIHSSEGKANRVFWDEFQAHHGIRKPIIEKPVEKIIREKRKTKKQLTGKEREKKIKELTRRFRTAKKPITKLNVGYEIFNLLEREALKGNETAVTILAELIRELSLEAKSYKSQTVYWFERVGRYHEKRGNINTAWSCYDLALNYAKEYGYSKKIKILNQKLRSLKNR